MANQAAIAIETARLHHEELKMQAMEKELEVGRQIQLSLLPQVPPSIHGWEFAAVYEAAWEVGGDFYDFFEVPPGSHQLGMVIADVTGKGVPAALLMAQASIMIRSTAQASPGPSSALEQVNQLLFQHGQLSHMFTALYAVLDTLTGRMVYANAGHCRPLWVQAKAGKVSELAARGIILGALDRFDLQAYGIDLEEEQIDVQPDDLLVFFSDGVTEAMNAKHQMFGNERLQSIVAANAGASAQEMLEAIVDAVKAFTGAFAQSDDFTLFVARRSSRPT
jgi:sigma-B regulation protein RsbU (phosphoserine phosphatase)